MGLATGRSCRGVSCRDSRTGQVPCSEASQHGPGLPNFARFSPVKSILLRGQIGSMATYYPQGLNRELRGQLVGGEVPGRAGAAVGPRCAGRCQRASGACGPCASWPGRSGRRNVLVGRSLRPPCFLFSGLPFRELSHQLTLTSLERLKVGLERFLDDDGKRNSPQEGQRLELVRTIRRKANRPNRIL